MKIIIGVDDSAYSNEALKFVKGVRWAEGTRFIVVSAVTSGSVAVTVAGEPGGYGLYPEAIEELTKLHQEFTARAELDLRSAGLQTEARVEVGDPGGVILRMAEKEMADLIVVGSHGRSGLTKLLMGSVASHVVTHAPCSVLVVKLRK